MEEEGFLKNGMRAIHRSSFGVKFAICFEPTKAADIAEGAIWKQPFLWREEDTTKTLSTDFQYRPHCTSVRIDSTIRDLTMHLLLINAAPRSMLSIASRGRYLRMRYRLIKLRNGKKRVVERERCCVKVEIISKQYLDKTGTKKCTRLTRTQRHLNLSSATAPSRPQTQGT